MKITKSRLKEIIKEEVEKVLKEGLEDSEAGSRHYQNVKRKERILKKAIKDGLTFDQVQDKYTEFYDLDPEYYEHLKTEKPDEALEEEDSLEEGDQAIRDYYKKKDEERRAVHKKLTAAKEKLKSMSKDYSPARREQEALVQKLEKDLDRAGYTGD